MSPERCTPQKRRKVGMSPDVEAAFMEARGKIKERAEANRNRSIERQLAECVECDPLTATQLTVTDLIVAEEPVKAGLAKVGRAKRQSKGEASGLVPDRHQQADFFVADLVDYAMKDDQATMEAPVFSLATKTDKKLWRWTSSDGKKTVEVAPGFYGRATQHDKDVLIYCTSQLVASLNAGKRPPRVVRFTAYDFFVATNRNTRRDDYERLRDTLNRLAGTQITTNIVTGKSREAKGFGVIDSWKVVQKSPDDTRMVAIEVKLSDWLFQAIESKEVLTINRDYFALRKPVERRLYEIARKHVGLQPFWEIGIEALRDKCGSTVARLRQFRGDLEEIIEGDTLPDYRLTLQVAGKACKARFKRKSVDKSA
jgi:plasmid replication initiation protein